MVRVFKNDTRLWKPFRRCSTFLLQTQLGRQTHSSGRHKRSSGRSVNKAAPRFRNLCVYEPSALRKKPSASLEETLRFSEEVFQFVEEAFQFAAETHHKRISEGRSGRAFRIAASLLKMCTIYKTHGSHVFLNNQIHTPK